MSSLNIIIHWSVLLITIAYFEPVFEAVVGDRWEWTEWKANVLAACVTAIPAYLMSRYWVWEVSGRNSLRNEIVPFWIIALLGLVVSSAFVAVSESIFDQRIFILGASFCGYLAVWVLKFFLLSRLFESAKSNVD